MFSGKVFFGASLALSMMVGTVTAKATAKADCWYVVINFLLLSCCRTPTRVLTLVFFDILSHSQGLSELRKYGRLPKPGSAYERRRLLLDASERGW